VDEQLVPVTRARAPRVDPGIGIGSLGVDRARR
jgi:hypothetical protein